MKLLTNILLSCFVVAVFTTVAAAKKGKGSKGNSASAAQTDADCDIPLPMTALDCCPMPRFIGEDIITACKRQAFQAMRNNNSTGKKPNGPPPEFFNCLIASTDMGTKNRNGVISVDLSKATKYLQAQLNATTKNDWNKIVTDGCSTCYKKSNNGKDDKIKTFLDCLITEFYTVSH